MEGVKPKIVAFGPFSSTANEMCIFSILHTLFTQTSYIISAFIKRITFTYHLRTAGKQLEPNFPLDPTTSGTCKIKILSLIYGPIYTPSMGACCHSFCLRNPNVWSDCGYFNMRHIRALLIADCKYQSLDRADTHWVCGLAIWSMVWCSNDNSCFNICFCFRSQFRHWLQYENTVQTLRMYNFSLYMENLERVHVFPVTEVNYWWRDDRIKKTGCIALQNTDTSCYNLE